MSRLKQEAITDGFFDNMYPDGDDQLLQEKNNKGRKTFNLIEANMIDFYQMNSLFDTIVNPD